MRNVEVQYMQNGINEIKLSQYSPLFRYECSVCNKKQVEQDKIKINKAHIPDTKPNIIRNTTSDVIQ